mgnify:CR=1 FL=1
MAINRSNIPVPEEVYNPHAAGQEFGNAFYQSLVSEINQAKMAKIKKQEQVYGLLKELSGNKYYDTSKVDWGSALVNPEMEISKVTRVQPTAPTIPAGMEVSGMTYDELGQPKYSMKPAEQLTDIPMYIQGTDNKLTPTIDPATGKPMTYKGKPGDKPEILKAGATNAQGDMGEQDFNKMSPQEQQAAIRIAKGDDMIEKYSGRGKLKDKLQFGAQQWAEQNGIPYNNYIAQNRATTLTDFSKGNAARNIRALNTVTGHLSDLKSTVTTSGNTPIIAYNKLANWYKKQTGKAAPTETGLVINAVVGELASVFKNSGATNEEIENLKKDIDINSSPSQFNKWIERAVHLMKSRMDALDEQWKQAFEGTGKTFKALNPKSPQILKNMGYDVSGEFGTNDYTGGVGASAVPIGTIDSGYRFKGGNPSDQNNWEAVQ